MSCSLDTALCWIFDNEDLSIFLSNHKFKSSNLIIKNVAYSFFPRNLSVHQPVQNFQYVILSLHQPEEYLFQIKHTKHSKIRAGREIIINSFLTIFERKEQLSGDVFSRASAMIASSRCVISVKYNVVMRSFCDFDKQSEIRSKSAQHKSFTKYIYLFFEVKI